MTDRSPLPERPLVLIVEDTPVHQLLFRENLQELQAECIVAEDGLAALAILEERLPNLIVLDLAMPRMDGFEFLRSLKTDPRTSNIPVLVVTAHGQSGTALEVAQLGAERYREKPLPRKALVELATELIESGNHGES